MLIIPYLSNSDIHRVAFIWWCLTNLRDQTANNSVCIVLITKSYSCCTFFSRTPHFFQLTNWFTHSISDILRICSKSLFVCLLAVWSHWCLQARLSYFLQHSLVDSWTAKKQKHRNVLLSCSEVGGSETIGGFRYQTSLLSSSPHPPPTPKSNNLFNDFSNREQRKKNCPQQTDLSGRGTVMQFFGTIFFFSDRHHALRNTNTKCVFSQ